VLLLASIAHAKLLYGDLEGTRSDMDAAWKILDTLENVESGVNAAYYGVAADYYKVRSCCQIPRYICCVIVDANLWVCRPKRSTLLTTETHYSILRVLILRRICLRKNVWRGRMILVFRHSWAIQSTTLESWYVFNPQRTLCNKLD